MYTYYGTTGPGMYTVKLRATADDLVLPCFRDALGCRAPLQRRSTLQVFHAKRPTRLGSGSCGTQGTDEMVIPLPPQFAKSCTLAASMLASQLCGDWCVAASQGGRQADNQTGRQTD